MMFHKLYGPEEWAQMVQDVVEKSKAQYKPLAEQSSSDRKYALEAQVVGRVQLKAEAVVKDASVETHACSNAVEDANKHNNGVAPEKLR